MLRRNFIAATGASALGIGSAKVLAEPSSKPQWKQDGNGLLAKIGVLTPQGDPVPESEIKAMAPPGVSTHSSIVRWALDVNRTDNFKRFLEPPHLENAAELL